MAPAVPLLRAAAPLKAIVLPTDFSRETEGLLPVALAIAERTGAIVHLVQVLAEAARSTVPWREQQAQARLATTRMQYRHSLLGRAPMQIAVLPSGQADDALAAYVERHGAGLVLVPGSGDRAEGRAPRRYPVLVVPSLPTARLRRLVSVGAPGALTALLGQALSGPIVTHEMSGPIGFQSDALLIAADRSLASQAASPPA